jgi:S1-C subfamily serine protease
VRKLLTRRAPAVAAGAALAAMLVIGCGAGSGPEQRTVPSTPPRRAVPKPLTVPQVIARTRRSIVRLSTQRCAGGGLGSGFLVAPRLVATAAHVVAGSSSIHMRTPGGAQADGEVVGFDRERDLALVRAEGPFSGRPLRFRSRAPQVGEDVVALGYPLGLPLTATKGSVTGVHRNLDVDGVRYRNLFQTDAAINPGNSGGPIIDRRGRVAGMVVVGGEGVNGIGFGIPPSTLEPLLAAWRAAPEAVDVSSSCQVPPATTESTPVSQPVSLTPYTGGWFDVDYPEGWNVVAAEEDKGSYLDTTIQDPADDGRLIRVDVAPGNTSDGMTSALKLEAGLRGLPGYRRIALTEIEFQGFPAVRWEYLLDASDGRALRSVNVQFTNGEDGWAILTRAPDAEFPDWESTFDEVRSSLAIADPGDPGASAGDTSTAGASCSPDYDPCVPDVPYDLNCADIGFEVAVIGDDVYGLDADGDGFGCESYG